MIPFFHSLPQVCWPAVLHTGLQFSGSRRVSRPSHHVSDLDCSHNAQLLSLLLPRQHIIYTVDIVDLLNCKPSPRPSNSFSSPRVKPDILLKLLISIHPVSLTCVCLPLLPVPSFCVLASFPRSTCMDCSLPLTCPRTTFPHGSRTPHPLPLFTCHCSEVFSGHLKNYRPFLAPAVSHLLSFFPVCFLGFIIITPSSTRF